MESVEQILPSSPSLSLGIALMAADRHQIDTETQKQSALGCSWWRNCWQFSGSTRRKLIGNYVRLAEQPMFRSSLAGAARWSTTRRPGDANVGTSCSCLS
ncbi:unnamed protein product [Victoria cruziana]